MGLPLLGLSFFAGVGVGIALYRLYKEWREKNRMYGHFDDDDGTNHDDDNGTDNDDHPDSGGGASQEGARAEEHREAEERGHYWRAEDIHVQRTEKIRLRTSRHEKQT
ncbi:nickel/cobalt efflux system RcnA-like [Neolamprologus brichardi]|uniref:nickel/cobalt efflux system RcnA-like n=1 Tax=Neolamprologus brichardi TaxID=32507 RepID=UPI0016438A16|nr:nickel/cobalt efflux system RcnA-like [Neolamprologus brichardi]